MRSLSVLFYCMLPAGVLPKKQLTEWQKLNIKSEKGHRFLKKKDEDHYLSGKILQLTDDNFDKIIHENQHVLVAFHAPWCPGCGTWLQKDFQTVSDRLAKAAPPVLCGEVSTSNDRDLAQSLHIEVEEYPRLLFFKNKKRYDDISPSKMSIKGMIRWVQKKIQAYHEPIEIQGVKTLSSVTETKDYLKAHRYLVLGCFNNYIPQAFQNVSKELAKKDGKFTFAFTQVPEVAEYFKVKVPGMMLFIPGDEMSAKFRGNVNKSQDIRNFVKAYSHAAILDHEASKTEDLLRNDGRAGIICMTKPFNDLGQLTRSNFVEAALKLNRKMISVIVHMDERWSANIGNVFDLPLPCGGILTNTMKVPDHLCPEAFIGIVEYYGDQYNQRTFKLPLNPETGFYTIEEIYGFANDYLTQALPELQKNDL